MINKSSKQRRKIRTRAKVHGTAARPRLSVFRSNKYIYAQLIDDTKGETLVSVSETSLKISGSKINRAKEIGMTLGKSALAKKIKKVVFDRGSFSYHGRVKAVADGVREGGLEF